MTDEQIQVIVFAIEELKGAVRDLSQLVRNALANQELDHREIMNLRDRVAIFERGGTDPCPPPAANGNGDAA